MSLFGALALAALTSSSLSAQVTVSPVIDAKDATQVVETSKIVSFDYQVKNKTGNKIKVTVMPSAVAWQDYRSSGRQRGIGGRR